MVNTTLYITYNEARDFSEKGSDRRAKIPSKEPWMVAMELQAICFFAVFRDQSSTASEALKSPRDVCRALGALYH
jgi:hypothetical protein